ncbi:MAG: hypothetical protein IJ412_03655 [Oscillospiraceae bacterium]|nr:hypothetical protein [Oscillospiraceae bacterium]
MKPIFTGYFGRHHIQGIALDLEKGYLYCSFTTQLVKLTLDGKLVGSVGGLTGHLGCIAFNRENGKVYGSLEYKNDAIGKGIAAEGHAEDAFLMTVFDVDKIDRPGMDAEADGVVRAVYLKEVVEDYHGTGVHADGSPAPHRCGCSGIDGTAIGPMFGAPRGSKPYLFVAYGIYGETDRADNDHQVLLGYDLDALNTAAVPLSAAIAHGGEELRPAGRFFAFTGNTTWGVQNLEYDPFTHAYFMAVYPGTKPQYGNYPLYALDAAAAPVHAPLQGLDEAGALLTLKPGTLTDAAGVSGWDFPWGSTGMFAAGDGTWYISREGCDEQGQYSHIHRYVWDRKAPFVEKDT